MFAAVCFEVDADASPGLLSRLLQPFARRDLVPDDFQAVHRGGTMHVGIRMDAIPVEAIHLVEGNLRQVIGVRAVTTRSRQMPPAAPHTGRRRPGSPPACR